MNADPNEESFQDVINRLYVDSGCKSLCDELLSIYLDNDLVDQRKLRGLEKFIDIFPGHGTMYELEPEVLGREFISWHKGLVLKKQDIIDDGDLGSIDLRFQAVCQYLERETITFPHRVICLARKVVFLLETIVPYNKLFSLKSITNDVLYSKFACQDLFLALHPESNDISGLIYHAKHGSNPLVRILSYSLVFSNRYYFENSRLNTYNGDHESLDDCFAASVLELDMPCPSYFVSELLSRSISALENPVILCSFINSPMRDIRRAAVAKLARVSGEDKALWESLSANIRLHPEDFDRAPILSSKILTILLSRGFEDYHEDKRYAEELRHKGRIVGAAMRIIDVNYPSGDVSEASEACSVMQRLFEENERNVHSTVYYGAKDLPNFCLYIVNKKDSPFESSVWESLTGGSIYDSKCQHSTYQLLAKEYIKRTLLGEVEGTKEHLLKFSSSEDIANNVGVFTALINKGVETRKVLFDDVGGFLPKALDCSELLDSINEASIDYIVGLTCSRSNSESDIKRLIAVKSLSLSDRLYLTEILLDDFDADPGGLDYPVLDSIDSANSYFGKKKYKISSIKKVCSDDLLELSGLEEKQWKYVLAVFSSAKDGRIPKAAKSLLKFVSKQSWDEMQLKLIDIVESETKGATVDWLIPMISCRMSDAAAERMYSYLTGNYKKKKARCKLIINALHASSSDVALSFLSDVSLGSFGSLSNEAFDKLKMVAEHRAVKVDDLIDSLFRIPLFLEVPCSISVTSSGDIGLIRGDGRFQKSFPKNTWSIDDDVYKSDKTLFNTFKKSYKDLRLRQSVTLQKAAIINKKWSFKQWSELYLRHPVVSGFVSSVSWVAENESGVEFFKVNEGKILSISGEERNLDDFDYISLFNPLYFPGSDEVATSDDFIFQSFKSFVLTQSEIESTVFYRFTNIEIPLQEFMSSMKDNGFIVIDSDKGISWKRSLLLKDVSIGVDIETTPTSDIPPYDSTLKVMGVSIYKLSPEGSYFGREYLTCGEVAPVLRSSIFSFVAQLLPSLDESIHE